MNLTTLRLRYGKGHIAVNIPGSRLMGEFALELPQLEDGSNTLVRRALDEPIGSPRLSELTRPGQQIVILCSDLTRPCPSDLLLPYLAQELTDAGIPDDDILIVIALGTHRPMTEAEIKASFGVDITERFRIVNHDPNDVVHLGRTSSGTPVEIFRPVVEADLRLSLGNVGFHYFAGFGGGAKAIMPGCASQEAIAHNHAMMVTPEASTGRLRGNPVREDLEEAAQFLPIDFILNVVLDTEQQVVRAAAGDMIAAHRDLCQFILQHQRVTIPRKADIVLASAGGFPKDINLYQAHTTLEIAAGFAKQGGIIVLAAECGEGFGSDSFRGWFQEAESGEEIIRRLQREFVLGGHKAAAISSLLTRHQILFVSDMPDDDVIITGMTPFKSCQEAMDHALDAMGSSANLIFLPAASILLPDVSG